MAQPNDESLSCFHIDECLHIDAYLWGDGEIKPDNPNLPRYCPRPSYCRRRGNHNGAGNGSNTGTHAVLNGTTNSNNQILPMNAWHNNGRSVSAFGFFALPTGLQSSTSATPPHFTSFGHQHVFAPTPTLVQQPWPRRPRQNQRPPQPPWQPARQPPAPATNPSMSNNYKGNPHLAANQSDNIPESESCAVWITWLPPDCTVSMLLNKIRRCDKVYATHINKPKGPLMNCAAKVVFWSRQGVDRLLELQSKGQFTVGRCKPSIRMNRIRSRASKPGPESRVLHITGPKKVVNQDCLSELFKDNFQWEDDTITELGELKEEGLRYLEWCFSSYRCQAQNAFEVLQRQIKSGDDIWSSVQVFWGADPCAEN
ncbi:hypothetical protein PGQ11_014789 [Apiospora arundinis]|uniref:RRM Nup35-type domain-containing protein n=1 Tax=Apiospora arundinis TaxID=335852 RepID=A0ABR2HU63_9PEZI